MEVDYEIPPKSEWQTLRLAFVNYFEQSVFIRNPTYEPMCLNIYDFRFGIYVKLFVV